MATAIIIPSFLSGLRNDDDEVLNNGTVESYEAGTSTPTATWQDSSKSVSNGNSFTLDARGSAIVYGDNNYKFIIKDSLGVTVETWDEQSYTYGDDITDIVGQEIMSPAQKKIWQSLWADIAIEKADIDSIADLYSVTTEKTAYGTAYTNLNTYLNTTLSGFSDITTSTTLEASGYASGRAKFQSLWTKYFEEKADLFLAVVTAQKAQHALIAVANTFTENQTIQKNDPEFIIDAETGSSSNFTYFKTNGNNKWRAGYKTAADAFIIERWTGAAWVDGITMAWDGTTIDMGTSRLTGLVDPTANQNAATKAYVDQFWYLVTANSATSTSGTTTVSIDDWNLASIGLTTRGSHLIIMGEANSTKSFTFHCMKEIGSSTWDIVGTLSDMGVHGTSVNSVDANTTLVLTLGSGTITLTVDDLQDDTVDITVATSVAGPIQFVILGGN